MIRAELLLVTFGLMCDGLAAFPSVYTMSFTLALCNDEKPQIRNQFVLQRSRAAGSQVDGEEVR